MPKKERQKYAGLWVSPEFRTEIKKIVVNGNYKSVEDFLRELVNKYQSHEKRKRAGTSEHSGRFSRVG